MGGNCTETFSEIGKASCVSEAGTVEILQCDTCRQQDAVVEQQGELIRFLQRRCDNLAREVLHLQAREDRWAVFTTSIPCKQILLL